MLAALLAAHPEFVGTVAAITPYKEQVGMQGGGFVGFCVLVPISTAAVQLHPPFPKHHFNFHVASTRLQIHNSDDWLC